MVFYGKKDGSGLFFYCLSRSDTHFILTCFVSLIVERTMNYKCIAKQHIYIYICDIYFMEKGIF